MAKTRPEGRHTEEPSDEGWQTEVKNRVTKYLEAKQHLTAVDFVEVGREIKDRRKALGISQETLAQLAGVAYRTVNRLEQGIPGRRSVNQILFTLTTLEKKKGEGSTKKPSRKK